MFKLNNITMAAEDTINIAPVILNTLIPSPKIMIPANIISNTENNPKMETDFASIYFDAVVVRSCPIVLATPAPKTNKYV